MDYILVTVSGPDTPGITSALMKILVKHQSNLSDMGQSVTHGLLSLSFLLDGESSGSNVIKDLLFEAKNKGLSLDFQAVENGIKNSDSRPEKFILSCVAPENLPTAFLADVSSLLAENQINIQRIDNNSAHQFRAIDITTSCAPGTDWKKIKESLIAISDIYQVDTAFLRDNIYRRNKRLIVFDMDSTLIQTEVIDEMAELAGVGADIRLITEEAMNGRMDFNESLTKRVAQLAGLSKHDLQTILDRLPLTPGVEEFIKIVKTVGYKTAVISGGFSFFANALKDKLGLDYAFANELEFEGEKMTGKVVGNIINAEQKALLVDLLAQQEKICLEQVVAVGDGANDLPMLSKVGLGIAFHAKEIVRRQSREQMSHGPMTSLLSFLGISEAEAQHL